METGNVVYHINKLKEKKPHTIILLDTPKKSLTKSIPLHDKTPREIRKTREMPKHNKDNLQQTYNRHQLKWRETQSNSVKSGTRQGFHYIQYSIRRSS